MHLIVPFAAPLSEAGRAAAQVLQLPALARLLREWAVAARDDGDAMSLSPPHERALAAALSWRADDGCLPWAARAAAADGIDTGSAAWGLLTPTQWHVGTEQVSLLDPETLQLGDADARALFAAVEPLFTSLGYALHYGAPLRWYAAHESLAALPTASLDRVVGRNVDAWLGGSARPVRRLQSEVQMLLHEHPVNADRERRGLAVVNSFWISGCGRPRPVPATEPAVDGRLRQAALAEDWPAWSLAWGLLDAGPVAALRGNAAARLTLCGERGFVTLSPGRSGWLQRWRAPSPADLLAGL